MEEIQEETDEKHVWVPSTREEILAADRADATHKVWQGKRIIGFRRWIGMDDRWHAALVLEDHTRLVTDEQPPPTRHTRSPCAKGWNEADHL